MVYRSPQILPEGPCIKTILLKFSFSQPEIHQIKTKESSKKNLQDFMIPSFRAINRIFRIGIKV